MTLNCAVTSLCTLPLYTLIDCLHRFPAYTGFLAISTYLFTYFSIFLIYLLPVYLLPVKYLLIYLLIYFNLMAYGHTPTPHVVGILSERQCQNRVLDQ